MNELTPGALNLLNRARVAAKSGRARSARIAAGLSQSDVARLVDVKATAIYGWESGTRRPRGRGGVRYAQLLDRLGALSDDAGS